MRLANSRASVRGDPGHRRQASKAQIIDVTKLPQTGRVVFGATVTVLKSDTEEEITDGIVGDDEADFKVGV